MIFFSFLCLKKYSITRIHQILFIHSSVKVLCWCLGVLGFFSFKFRIYEVKRNSRELTMVSQVQDTVVKIPNLKSSMKSRKKYE